jgi:hypothetical protein
LIVATKEELKKAEELVDKAPKKLPPAVRTENLPDAVPLLPK